MPLIPQRCCAGQGCHFSACLASTEHGTMVTENKGQSTQALGWRLLLVHDPGAEHPGVQWGERSRDMRTTSAWYFGIAAVGIAVLLTAAPARLSAQQTPPGISIG